MEDDVDDVTDTGADVGEVCLREVVTDVESAVGVDVSADESCTDSDVESVVSDDVLCDGVVD